MDVTELKNTTGGKVDITIDKEASTDDFLVIVAYYDAAEDNMTVRVDNYHLADGDPIKANMRRFRDSMEVDGVEVDHMERRKPNAPSPPYSLPSAPPPRKKGYYA